MAQALEKPVPFEWWYSYKNNQNPWVTNPYYVRHSHTTISITLIFIQGTQSRSSLYPIEVERSAYHKAGHALSKVSLITSVVCGQLITFKLADGTMLNPAAHQWLTHLPPNAAYTRHWTGGHFVQGRWVNTAQKYTSIHHKLFCERTGGRASWPATCCFSYFYPNLQIARCWPVSYIT